MGLAVEGIDAAPEMVGQLRLKPGGEHLPVEVGDFSSTVRGRRYALVVLAFNTVNTLPHRGA